MFWKQHILSVTVIAMTALLLAGACDPAPPAPAPDVPPVQERADPPTDDSYNRIRPADPKPALRPAAEPEISNNEESEPIIEGNTSRTAADADPVSDANTASPVINGKRSSAVIGQGDRQDTRRPLSAGEGAERGDAAPAATAIEHLAALSESFRAVARAASPSVVQVAVEARPTARRGPPAAQLSPDQMEEMLRRFGPLLERNPELRDFFRRQPDPGHESEQPDFDQYNVPMPIGNASGWVYDEEGHVVTSHHVVAQAGDIRITFHDGTEAPAELVGSDPPTDVAVLRTAKRDSPAAVLASRNVEQGDIVLAIGSPFRYAFSVSQGIVSATERQVGILGPHGYESFIQTDAAINPGNSGGPLINSHGEVVGMCTAIASRSGAFAGLGFATPVEMIREVVDALIREGVVQRGYLGAMINDDSRLLASFGVQRGVLIEDLVEGGPAERAGLVPGDVVGAIDDEPVEDAASLRQRIARTEPGTPIDLTLFRDDQWGKLEVTLGRQPVEAVEPGPADEALDRDPAGAAEAEALAKLGFQRLLTLTPEIAQREGFKTTRGLLVLDVRPFSAAAIAGLRRGVIILQVQGRDVATVDDLRDAVEERDLHEGVRLRVQIPGGPARFVLLSLRP